MWDLTLTTEHGLHGNIYSSLLGLKTQSLETVSCCVLSISFIFLTMKGNKLLADYTEPQNRKTDFWINCVC